MEIKKAGVQYYGFLYVEHNFALMNKGCNRLSQLYRTCRVQPFLLPPPLLSQTVQHKTRKQNAKTVLYPHLLSPRLSPKQDLSDFMGVHPPISLKFINISSLGPASNVAGVGAGAFFSIARAGFGVPTAAYPASRLAPD